MIKQPKVLILGITGGVGGAAADAFLARGWRIVALTRRAASERGRFAERVTWIEGDAMNRTAVVAAAIGCDFIVHAVNPPKYQRWSELALPMLESTIAAASMSGAHILFPGTIYNFGRDAFPLLKETAPQHPTTRKGEIRVAMERRLELAARAGIRVTILRAGDFFGPHAGNSWFSQAMVRPGRPIKNIWCPAEAGAGHSWAYLPDVGETFARLAERAPTRENFAAYHFRGHWLPRASAMAESICQVAGIPLRRIGRFPWWAVRMTAPVVALFREMREMQYLWHESIELDNTKLVHAIGSEPHTALDIAVRRTLTALGCLPPLAPNSAPGMQDALT
jgi:nucleoside-diphosphate-sugar epimerase